MAEETPNTPGGSRRGPVVAAAAMVALAVVLWLVGRQEEAKVRYQASHAAYPVPDATLTDQNGAAVRAADLLRADRPTVLNFLYTTCTTISPVLSAGFASLQKQAGGGLHLVSVTIDPANDTPPMLKEYLSLHRAHPGWDFVTGTRADVDAVMRAFNAYMPTLESHYAVTFLRAPGASEWVRLQGLVQPSDLLREVRKLVPPTGKEKKP